MKNDEKYRNTKIKSYEEKISTKFHDDPIPKQHFHYLSLSVILIDSVFKMGKNYYYFQKNVNTFLQKKG